MTLEGELTFASVREWLARADELASAGRIDLARVTRVDSAGAALLLELTRRAKRDGRELVFADAGQPLRSLLEFLQIDDVLELA
jgi:ABC-type transporter Mla MlaB component